MAGWVTDHEIFGKNKFVALQKGSMVRKKDRLTPTSSEKDEVLLASRHDGDEVRLGLGQYFNKFHYGFLC